MGHHAPAGGHEFLGILCRALPGRHDGLPAARTVGLTVVLLTLYLGFPWRRSPIPDMTWLAARLLAAGVLATTPGPAGPAPVTTLPLLNFTLQLFQLLAQLGHLVLTLLELLAQPGILTSSSWIRRWTAMTSSNNQKKNVLSTQLK
jgi:hypothetical protein